MELAKLNDAKKAAAIMRIRDHMKQLLEAYERTRNKTPKDTVELLTEMIGRKACLEAVANLVNIRRRARWLIWQIYGKQVLPASISLPQTSMIQALSCGHRNMPCH